MDNKNLFSLAGKVIVVTGGTGVLGESFVKVIAAAGASVAIMGRNVPHDEDIARVRSEDIIKNGGKAMAISADVLDEASLVAAKDQVLAKFGKIDGLVNAAGGNMPGAVVEPDASIFELNVDALTKVLNLNLFGTILPTQVFGPEIVKNGSGSIVNISSMTAQRVITKVLGYSVAKTAIDGYTKWFAVELANRYGDKIRMNAIAPGFFLTEQNRTLLTNEDGSPTERAKLVIKQTPFSRFGTADELEGALLYLLSDASKFVTGSVLNIDGGFAAFGGV